MSNSGLVIRREYLERVHSKSFLVRTILLPAFMFCVTALPTKLVSMKTEGTRHLVVVASEPNVAEQVAAQLRSSAMDRKYSVNTMRADDQARSVLDNYVSGDKIDGYL